MSITTESAGGVVSNAFSDTPSVSNTAVGRFISRAIASDNLSLSDAIALNIGTRLVDTAAASDAISLLVGKVVADTVATSDSPVVAVLLAKADTATISEHGSIFFDDYSVGWAADYAGNTVIW